MNPLILLGLGAVAFMAMGKKKPKPVEDEVEEDVEEEEEEAGPVAQQFVATKLEPKKKMVMAKFPPLNYRGTINTQQSSGAAKQCHLQGMNDVEAITACVANKIFPDWKWDTRSGWQNDAWARMRNIARLELGIPIIPIS